VNKGPEQVEENKEGKVFVFFFFRFYDTF
jgi:hypothetical protein